MQLSINDLSMRFGARILFEDVRTTFISGRRYAITGPNGAGKSTLMKILTGEIEPEKGSVTRPKKMGVLRQDQFAFDAYRVLDTVIMGNSTLWDALQERETLYAKDSDTLTDRDGIRLGELEGIVGTKTATPQRRMRPFSSTVWISRKPCTTERWASCKADKRCASCWRRRCSATPMCCCSTNLPTTSIWIPFTGFRIT
jgi:energy-coupling factor transporter ATP-binding protein EcfA2